MYIAKISTPWRNVCASVETLSMEKGGLPETDLREVRYLRGLFAGGHLNFGSDGDAWTATQNYGSFGERFSPKKGVKWWEFQFSRQNTKCGPFWQNLWNIGKFDKMLKKGIIWWLLKIGCELLKEQNKQSVGESKLKKRCMWPSIPVTNF